MQCAEAIFAYKNSRPALAELPVLIFAGKGNNGGDGILIGSILSSEYGQKVTICCLQKISEMSDEIRRHYCSLPSDVDVAFFDTGSPLPATVEYSLIIDALLGIGFKGEMRSPVRELVGLINSSNMPVISIDIPSGIETDSGEGKDAVFADMTLTIGAQKRGLYVNDGRIHSGAVKFIDIGFDFAGIPENESEMEVITDVFSTIFGRHKQEMYKSRNGSLLIIGGSAEYPGAPVLAAGGANAVGAGLITLALKARPFSQIPANVIVRDFSSSGGCAFNADDAEKLFPLAEVNDCTVLGMGMTVSRELAGFVCSMMKRSRRLLLDADALNCIAGFPECFEPHECELVITPHYMEAVRLAKAFGIRDFAAMPRTEQAAALAERLDAVVVFKGEKTLISTPDGRLLVNPCGSYALAKGGSGDILSGIIGALLAQHDDIDAGTLAACGVYLHSAAADRDTGSRTAFNIDKLPEAVRNFISENTVF